VSNPTSSFGWQMPTAVDLVTDLPADFEVFGQAVDSSMADLLGGTSGQILAKNTNANMDFVWINNDQGDITGVTAGTGITVTDPTGPVPTVTNAMATEITAKGDLIVGTGNAAFDNLPAGTNDHVLTADSTVSPTGLKWAALPAGGAYTSLASGSIVNGLSLTSISGSYTDLYLVINNAAPTATDQIGIRINNNATGADYVGIIMRNITGTGATVNQGAWAFVDISGGSSVTSGTSNNSWVVYFPNYAGTTNWKTAYSSGGHNNNLSTFTSAFNSTLFKSTAAIDRLDFKTAGSDWANQGTYTLYGVK
jgi:hypothetical protein